MATEWYYSKNGSQHGPIAEAGLKALAGAGKLLPTDFVWKEGMQGWKPASAVKGLFAAPQPPSQPAAQPQPSRSPGSVLGGSVAALLPVLQRDELPEDLRGKPQVGEVVHYFSYIDAKGGCLTPTGAKQWILITDRRILFEASVKEGEGEGTKFFHQSGSIPMAKVSYVGTSSTKEQQGCNWVKVTNLRINSSGGHIVLAIPTKAEAQRAQEVIDGIISQSK
jgi:hypothetical protein